MAIPKTPRTSAETFLAAANGQNVTLPDPVTRSDKYLKEIAEKLQGGGSSVTVEPLEITENGTYTATSGKGYSPVKVDVPNPNYVETIDGSLRDVLNRAGLSFSKLAELFASNGLTAYITMSISDFTEAEPVTWLLSEVYNRGSASSRAVYFQYALSATQAGLLRYSSTLAFDDVGSEYVNDSGEVKTFNYDQSCTLTIIHHPLPAREGE